MSIFSSVKMKRPKLNKFDLSHERKFSLNMGKLIPIMCMDVVPGDRIRLSSEVMMRFAPMIAPIMHRVDVTVHHFFVPNRLIWNEWETFITGGPQGTSAPVSPYLTINDVTATNNKWNIGTLADYLGIPLIDATNVPISTPLNISALPFRAYQLIFNEYYRDQNLSNPVPFAVTSGSAMADIDALTTLRNRCWEKDYFTSALPWTQRGGEVSLPTEVIYKDQSDVLYENGTEVTSDAFLGTISTDPGGLRVNKGSTTGSAGNPGRIENIESVASATINELRRAFRLQEWLEKNARGGARYVEQILSHFGVRSSDARLQRPEYLGGGKAPCVISEVLSTVVSPDTTTPQGNMAGHGISVGKTNSFSRMFEEHGYVISLMSVLPRTAYQQGIPRHFLRDNKLEYAWPEFGNLGEQEIWQAELLFSDTAPNHKDTFGYQSRYAEYKYIPSSVHADMKASLAYWHMGRQFAGLPILNESFVTSDPTTRIFAVTDVETQHLYCQIYNRLDALRPLPYYGTPAI